MPMKYWITAFLLLFTTSSASAQLSFTSADFLSAYAKASTSYTSTDLSGLPALIAATGSGQTWNFTGRTYGPGGPSTNGVILPYPSGAAFANDPSFTSATNVLLDTTTANVKKY